ncbi:hypothetical protein H5410_046155 [Solanum commersonii]|uniref:Uncharacterized protein n=1 Tax=Solanum commersonii TaxID=4109 RepID=A0A9J5XBH2_SOLCO|nr:hypothetical protein H5410_046155 [Solanum commersonii]
MFGKQLSALGDLWLFDERYSLIQFDLILRVRWGHWANRRTVWRARPSSPNGPTPPIFNPSSQIQSCKPQKKNQRLH